jgi:hypothetical protein
MRVAGVRVGPLAGGLRHTPGIIALVALARERGWPQYMNW